VLGFKYGYEGLVAKYYHYPIELTTDNTDEMIARAVQAARDRSLVQRGDTLVITAGAAGTAPGTTNLIKIHTVE